ncbi:cystatin-like protein [Arabidopsis thaliana]|uniref:Cystatin-like protein n=2 Tax=Arabidopsis thaliana TaxID=3702 RepID=F4J7B4_ARATH|nr:cystatin-like protein [Arabidopsis thaliana]AEE74242.1 cystatin-like protein [Arabidopsis thaliana]|eukprot:NP_187196.4 cystatin-like protein [Arabidopsis thaliana]
MAPKSCDGEVNDGSSSDVNVMEPMETSTGVGLSFLGKRRAETPNPGESEQIADEDGEEYESVEDVVVEDDRIRGGRDEEDSEPEWGYDSFDGREYHSSDQMGYSDKEVSLSRQTVFLPSGVELVRSTILKRTLGKALPSGLNVKLEHILRANYNPGSMSKFYITFAARESDSPDAPSEEYQAKAAWSAAEKTYPIFCRPSESKVYSIIEMAPKSSDGETKYGSSSDGEIKCGSSSENQSTESMEITTGDESSMLGKRKVETTDLEDPDENDEEDPDENDEEDSESDSDSEWDKDSFDGREYHSSDDQREYATKDLEKRARFYKRTVIETKSSAEFPPYLWGGIATLRGLDEKMRTGVTGFNVKLDHVLRANFNPGGRTTYYITFAARESDSPDAPLVEYQAKVDWSAGKTYPILCRPTSPKLVEVDGGAQLKKVSEEIIN